MSNIFSKFRGQFEKIQNRVAKRRATEGERPSAASTLQARRSERSSATRQLLG